MNKSKTMADFILKNNLLAQDASSILKMFPDENRIFLISDVHNAMRLIDKGYTYSSALPKKRKRNKPKDLTWFDLNTPQW